MSDCFGPGSPPSSLQAISKERLKSHSGHLSGKSELSLTNVGYATTQFICRISNSDDVTGLLGRWWKSGYWEWKKSRLTAARYRHNLALPLCRLHASHKISAKVAFTVNPKGRRLNKIRKSELSFNRVVFATMVATSLCGRFEPSHCQQLRLDQHVVIPASGACERYRY